MDDSTTPNTPTSAGGMPSLVKHFSIEGLYGYRSLALDSEFAATVLIAKNGSGKTTLLGALDAFLQGQFSRFAGLEFSVIRCRLAGVSDELILSQSDVEQLVTIPEGTELHAAAAYYEIEPHVLLEALHDVHLRTTREQLDNPAFYKIHAKLGYNIAKAKVVVDKLRQELAARFPTIEEIRKKIRDTLGPIEIVYLPTFRRVEMSLPDIDDARTGRRKLSMLARLGLSKRGLHSGDIQFGLADISERLAKLHQEMLFQSNQGYREISANIINDLISGEFDRENPSLDQRPSPEALKIFFERVQEGRQMGPYEVMQIPDVDRIYKGTNLPEASDKFLQYFLGKLNTVMKKTRGVEDVVEEFIRNCNRYLSADDESATLEPSKRKSTRNDDDKLLKLDRRSLKVSVISVSTQRPIPLDALSSGEKQMISLFARLYLYPTKKIVLIDEPELSLSLDWQRKILVDIVTAPSCVQVIAITHSPFVFDNDLDQFATSLKLRLNPIASLDIDEEDGNA
ncbi:AAA family ATPase [uncultured Ramlibacter sp.]|uniref:AAA family ATPase n=1 Tax=uncultured Ramlibacter sp. TaxID=260755 RepID=UPI0026124ACA|nr:AAA family ATPase [uncultured Ramlibacter sp.]